jgi:hypothetical protein
MATSLMTAGIASAQMQGVTDRANATNPVLAHDLEMMAGLITDIQSVVNRADITVEQRQQAMKVLGQMGAVMQQMATAKEVEGWQQSKQNRKIYDLKNEMDVLKKQIAGE